MPPKSSKKASKRRTLEWISSPSRENCLIPGYPNDEGAEESHIDSLICSGVLEAKVCKLHETLLPDTIPKRADFIYINPATQKTCSFPIGEPVLLFARRERTPPKQIFCIAFPWPVAKVPLDNVAIGQVTRLNCKVEPGDMVCLSKLPCSVSTAATIELKSMECSSLSWEKVFLDYVKHSLEGRLLLPGNLVQVHYYGEPRRILVTRVDGVDGCLNSESSYKIESVATSTPVRKDQSLSFSLADDSELPSRLSSLCLDSELDEREGRMIDDSPPELAFAYKISSKTHVLLDENRSSKEKRKRVDEVTYSDIGGLVGPIQQIRETAELPLKAPKLFSSLGVSPPRGVLLHGPTGTGKTLLAKAVAFESQAYVVAIDGPEVMSRYYGETEAKLRELFQEASSHPPAIILMDELDALCPRRDAVSSDFEKRVVAMLCTLMDGISSVSDTRVVVIAATNRIDAIDPALRRPGRFDREIEIGIPTAAERLQILKALLKTVPHCLSHDDLEAVAELAHGHVGADLAAVCKGAVLATLKRALKDVNISDIDSSHQLPAGSATVTLDDMKAGLTQVRPSAMREVIVDVPKVYWTDVGGQEHVKQKLREAVEWPLKHPEAFSRLGIKPPRGLLMYGPPGCSKTLIAKALATESGLNFISVKGPELLSQWVGESEKAVRQVFKKARAAAPSVIFFDEIDALAIHRGSDGSNVGDRVLSQILTEMDGIELLSDVTILAATNRPDMIDKALMRPGRLDQILYVPLPDLATRKAIFQIQFRTIPVGTDVNVDELSEKTKNYSGAEIAAVCREAALCALREDFNVEQVTIKHFDAALTQVRPQTSMETVRGFEDFSKN